MISFKTFFKQKTARFFILLFAAILLIANMALYSISAVQYKREINRQEEAFSEMMVHLITMESEDVAIVYVEHYNHTQGINIAYYDESDNLLYETPKPPETSNILILRDFQDNIVGKVVFDSEKSFLGQEFTYGMLIFNGLSLVLFFVFLQLLYRYLNRQYNLLEDDLENIGKKVNKFNFSDLSSVSHRLEESMEKERDLRKYQKEYIRILAHDIKTPLTVIKAYLEGIKLNRIKQDKKITDDMLAEVSEIERLIPKFMAQNPDQFPKKQNIAPIINKIIKRLKEVFNTKNIKLSTHIDDYELEISKLDISRIVEHLLFNAFYYSNEADSVEIHLDKDKQLLSVKDSGIGMDEITLNAIKAGPYRSEKAIKKHEKGSGIGLQIVYEIVQRLNFSIDIFSELNKGTEVTIKFN